MIKKRPSQSESLLTRRVFLQGLVPPWLTKRTARFAGGAAITVLVLLAAATLIRDAGVFGLLKTMVFATAGAIALWLGAALLTLGAAVVQRAPPSLGALLSVLGQILNLAMIGAAGAWLYRAWQRGDNLTGCAIGLGVFFLVRFLDEWAKRAGRADPVDRPHDEM